MTQGARTSETKGREGDAADRGPAAAASGDSELIGSVSLGGLPLSQRRAHRYGYSVADSFGHRRRRAAAAAMTLSEGVGFFGLNYSQKNVLSAQKS